VSRKKKRRASSASREAAARRRRGVGRLRLAALFGLVAIGGVLVALAAFFLVSPWSSGSSGPRAVIVDQLSLTQPNPAFIETATGTLERAGYAVDYYPGGGVTVDFYRDLPTHGYDLVILRVHGGRVTSEEGRREYVGLFTSEPYRGTAYQQEQKQARLVVAWYHKGSPAYFGILPDFVAESMKGTFEGATVILMTCDGLRSEETAEAFVRKGAGYVVGWSDLVSAEHTDKAAERLLRHLLIDGLPIRDAVALTAVEVGPDPAYGSTLKLYPSGEAASAAP